MSGPQQPTNPDTDMLRHTPLHALHLEQGGKMVPFAGYAMPVQYADGIIAEHTHTRTHAGLFDVSHMGQAHLTGPDYQTVAAALEAFVPGDILGLAPGAMRYSVLLDEAGGILDDLIVTRPAEPERDGTLILVVNAATKDADFRYLDQRLAGGVSLEILNHHALLALQGPAAAAALSECGLETDSLIFMTARAQRLMGADCYLSRSGYTGEDGFEISVPDTAADALARRLLELNGVKPVGLGARDSLRLEAGLCLYGHDISPETTPVEAGLQWAIGKSRRRRADFPGADHILHQIEHGTDRVRVGLRPQDRGLVRQGAEIVNGEGRKVGLVTSGTYGPTLGGPVAMGYVETEYAAVGTRLGALVRGKPRPVVTSKLPFVPPRYYRG